MIPHRRGARSQGILALVIVTAIHGIYRTNHGSVRFDSLEDVTTLQPGQGLPAMTITVLRSAAPPVRRLIAPLGGCTVLVAYDPSCPYSVRAAAREASRLESPELAILWLTDGDAGGAGSFLGLVHPLSMVGQAGGALDALGILGVPAALLIDSDGRLLRAWPYRGDEDHQKLLEACATASVAKRALDKGVGGETGR